MLLKDIHDSVRYYAKKAQRGAISPEQIDSAIDQAQLTLFMQRLGFPQEYQRGMPTSRMGLGVSKRINDDLRVFMTPVEDKAVINGKYVLPDDYVTTNSLMTETVVGTRTIFGKVDEIRVDQLADRFNSQIDPPTLQNPVAVFLNNEIHFYPKELTKVKFSYLRLPKKPKLGYEYTPGGRNYTVREDTTVNLEWPVSMKNEIIMGTLNLLSIPVKDQYNQQVSEMKRQQGS